MLWQGFDVLQEALGHKLNFMHEKIVFVEDTDHRSPYTWGIFCDSSVFELAGSRPQDVQQSIRPV